MILAWGASAVLAIGLIWVLVQKRKTNEILKAELTQERELRIRYETELTNEKKQKSELGDTFKALASDVLNQSQENF
ncbi:MAG: hypothetical protein KDD25_09830, partial [Bdellovibrionales bacterium]|nr:hypothetical protein [Bdellovibrionales bacterium]